MHKPTYQIRNPYFFERKGKKYMLAQQQGDCPIRGWEDGSTISTSAILAMSDDSKTVETVNSIYQINKGK